MCWCVLPGLSARNGQVRNLEGLHCLATDILMVDVMTYLHRDIISYFGVSQGKWALSDQLLFPPVSCKTMSLRSEALQ